MTFGVVAVASSRGTILAHALLPSAPSRLIVLNFRIHELKGVDARFRTFTRTVTSTTAVDACVGMATKASLRAEGES